MSSPLVPASSRWTIPGRSVAARGGERDPHAEQAVDERPGPPPASGCVTGPAGFATTSRCSSSNRTATGGPSGRAGHRSARCTTTRSPPSSRKDFALGRPSTRTSPAAIARCTSARGDPISRRQDGVQPSRRRRRTPYGTSSGAPRRDVGRTLLAEGRPRDDDRPDDDRAVGEVEHRPDVQVDEVDDVARRGRDHGGRGRRGCRARPPRTSPSASGVTRRSASGRRSDDQHRTTISVAAAKNHGRRCPRLKAPPVFVVYRRVRTPGSARTACPRGRARPTTFVTWSTAKTTAAVGKRIVAPRRARASTDLPARPRLGVLDAEVDVRKRLDPRLLDRLAAALADPVASRRRSA